MKLQLFFQRDRIFLFVILFFYLLACHYYITTTADDLYISFRYARNWAEGLGLVFNPGERVEGFSNFLWVAIMAVGHALRIDLPGMSKILSIFFGLAGIIMVWQLCKSTIPPSFQSMHWLGLLATGLMAISHPWIYWSASGMETTFFTALVIISIMLEQKCEHDATGFSRWRPWVYGALMLCRAEGFLFFIFSFIARVWQTLESRELRHLKTIGLDVLVMACLMGGIFLARYAYFGDLLPNTFWAKFGAGAWRVGWEYFLNFMRAYPWLILCAVLGWYSMAKFGIRAWRLLFVYSFGYTVFLVGVGGDWMWHFRLWLPVLALLWVSSAGVGALVGFWLRQIVWPGPIKQGLALLGLTVAILALSKQSLSGHEWLQAAQGLQRDPELCLETQIVEAHRKVAAVISSQARPGATVAANHIGALGFYSQLQILDMVGLTNRQIAKKTKGILHQKYDADFIIRSQPEYVVLTSRTQPKNGFFVSDYWSGETALYRHPQFQEKYRPWPHYWEYKFSGRSEYLVVFERKK